MFGRGSIPGDHLVQSPFIDKNVLLSVYSKLFLFNDFGIYWLIMHGYNSTLMSLLQSRVWLLQRINFKGWER